MFYDSRFLKLSGAILFMALCFITAPVLADTQLCSFCAKSAVSQESTHEAPSIGTSSASGQRCSFCAGVQRGTTAKQAIPESTTMSAPAASTSAPEVTGTQLCSFCATAAVSQESTHEAPSIGTSSASGQRCTFCAGVQ